MKKRNICILLLLLIAVLGIYVYLAQNLNGTNPNPPAENTTIAEQNAEVLAISNEPATRIITDVWGREVIIPEKVERIISLGSGAPRIAAYLDVVDMLVGAEASDVNNFTVIRDYNPVYHELLKVLPIVGRGGGSGNNNAYPEEIIMIAPDVILAAFSQEAADELQGQTGIPVVAVRYISTGLANKTFYAAMRVFAGVVGAQERCEMILSFIDTIKEDLNRRASGIPDSEKLRVYAGAVTFNGQHSFAGTYSNLLKMEMYTDMGTNLL